jgi:hypothetical protein
VTTATSKVCPACSFEQDDGGEACARCGVIFSKVRTGPAMRRPEVSAVVAPSIADASESNSNAWKLLGIGLIAAVIAHVLPFIRFVLSPLVTLLHEFGHAVAAWLLGCPAIPAFDFVYGGGVTHHKYFQLPLGILIGAGWAWLGWTFRRNPRTLTLIGICAGLWLIAVSSEWRREVVISSMGHGGELILAGVLLYMALSGVGWRIPEIERPLGAFAAFFVQIQTMQFAWKLRNDPGFLAWYREGKGGAMMNDLEVIALDIKIWTGASLDIPDVAGWLLALGPVTMGTAVLLFVYRERVNAFARSLLLLDSE